MEDHYSPEQIHAILYNGDNLKCSLRYIQKLCLLLHDNDFRENYLLGGPKQSGRPYSQSYFQRLLIRNHCLENKTVRLCKMYQDYCRMFYPQFDNANFENMHPQILSLSTFKRTIKRGKITRKVMERRNINQNPIQGLHFLEAIEHINPIYFVDCDETKQDRESRQLKYGFAPEGDVCTKDQIVINNAAYSTIAAVTPFGFMGWSIHEGNIDHQDFINFLHNELAPHILPHHHIVLDNATIHHFPATRIALEEIFNGNYWYSAPYSPHLKPIEPCFALGKEWIREHEDEAALDPVGTINRAFGLFQVGGERAYSVRGHWNGYFSNYEGYLENINA